jgi:hypothetical protein
MLAIHTSYDPLVPVRIPDMYLGLVEQSGSTGDFVQQYVKHDGHCNIQADEIAAGFSELRGWKDHGVRPHAGLHPVSTASSQGQSSQGQSSQGQSSQGQRADR